MKQFCIIANRDKDENLEITSQIFDYLKKHGKDVFLTEESGDSESYGYTDVTTIPENTQCAIVLGGDGTIIQAAHDLAQRNIPILGINLGTLGFLAEIELHHVFGALERLFQGDYVFEEHMMLSVKVNSLNGIVSQMKTIGEKAALNDVVVTRSGFSRLITVEVYVNGELVNAYRGDGVIVSTPTGSTGYNLSAGGPVVAPGADLMIITPICPHSLNTRSIVVSSNDTVLMKVKRSKKTQEDEAIVTLDGSSAINLSAEDYIEIRKSKETVQLIRFKDSSFFQVLKHKFGNNVT